MSLERYARAIPKVELHVHLEGAIRPATLLELAARNGVAVPPGTLDALADGVAFRDFQHFLEIFRAACACLRTAADFERAAYELGATLAAQHVRYAEVTVSASIHHHLNDVPGDTLLGGLAAARARVRADFSLDLAWIPNIVRWWADTGLIEPLADWTTDFAIEGRDAGVVALGLAGAEALVPPEPFAPRFERARAAGLHSAPHAGEHAGPESVWGALQTLHAERIAHGVRAVEDAALVAELAARRVPLDVCPISNSRLGVVPTLAEHPLPALLRAGVVATINSDDPAIFGTTLADEYASLVEPLGLSADQIDALALNGIWASFLPANRKAALEAAALADLAALKAEHLA